MANQINTNESAAILFQNDIHKRLETFGTSAIGLNRLFSGLQPLLFQTKLLALNAEVASARIGATGLAFGIVVKDLLTMSKDLEIVTQELEKVFGKVAEHVGIWIRCRTRYFLYLRTADALWGHYSKNATRLRNLRSYGILDEQIDLVAKQDMELRNAHTEYDRIWMLVLKNRQEAIDNLRAIHTHCHRLHRLLETSPDA